MILTHYQEMLPSWPVRLNCPQGDDILVELDRNFLRNPQTSDIHQFIGNHIFCGHHRKNHQSLGILVQDEKFLFGIKMAPSSHDFSTDSNPIFRYVETLSTYQTHIHTLSLTRI